MRVLKFAWHLFWAARRCPGESVASVVWNCLWNATPPNVDFVMCRDTELTAALRGYGR
jgi:hypothetical protein